MGTILGQKKEPVRRSTVASTPAAATTTSEATSSSSTSSSSSDSTSKDSETSPEKQREKNLLNRSRGSTGTVVSGFRGILTPSNQTQSQQRKTLLGE